MKLKKFLMKPIRKYRSELETLANTLLEKEVLEYEEFNELIKHIANPPISNEKEAAAM